MGGTDLGPEYAGAVQHFWYGHQHAPSRSDYEHAWRQVKAIAAADGRLTDDERLYLLGRMCAIGTPTDIVDGVMAYDESAGRGQAAVDGINVPAEMRPGVGAWLVYEALSVAMSDGDLAERELEAVRGAANAMGVAPGTVDGLIEQCREERTVRERRIELLQSTIETEFRFAEG